MPDVFLNFRTGDGDQLAAHLDSVLTQRFGRNIVFRDSKSIRPSTRFPQELIRNVRRSRVLLALIGPNWAASALLHDPADWVRREIEEAATCEIPILPVLNGKGTALPRRDQLPTSLAHLTERQYLSYTTRTSETDLDRIAAELLELIPELNVPKEPPSAPGGPGTNNSVSGGIHGTVIQTGPVGGDVGGAIGGTVIRENTGPVHTGRGDIHHSAPHFHGSHGTYVARDSYGGPYVNGENHGGIGNTYNEPPRADEPREDGDGDERR
ncbi:TIR domain-containing protein [Streptomyces sp. NPDC050560]|uniref:TIR domain-containing protein n=1 Tax=Streptomyces sp. NPDC050560 TaxID=3365630 RepID=UPI003791F957